VAVADVAKTALRVLRDHADAEMRRNRFILTLNAGLLVVAAGFVGAGILIVRWRIARPLLAMTGAMRRLAGHDLAVAIPGAGRGDEIGAMAGAVQVFRDSMLQADRLAEAQRAAQAQLEARTLRVEQLNRVFEESVRQALDTLASAANELTATAGSMSDIVTEATRQAAAVAAASDQASANVQTVSAATEQLSASIKEISRQIGQSSAVSGQAVNEAAETAATMRNLSDAAQKIGDVVQLISDIAGRTNLLALNATIEAARAGDAGKGFAVVASEVKSLATQTARATQDITTQVAAMQSSATASVEAITRIDKTISRMNEIVSAISAAVDEQSSATSEIARNVQNTASHTAKVSGNIGGLSRVVEQNGQAAMHVQGAAGELGRQSQTLRNQVDVFLAEIRAA
jgi:methyl-accepting chemotaxis protein